MSAHLYRLPRRYRYPRRRTADAWVPAVIGLAVAVAAAGSHPARAAGTPRPAPAGLTAVPVTNAGETAFMRAVLADLRAPATAADLSSLAAWAPHESTAARNNPLATTMPEPGATTFNWIGVLNYPTPAEGAYATARTIADGRYPLIYAALRSGTGVCGPSFAAEFLVWSGGGYQEVC